MKMTRGDLERASHWIDKLKRAERDQDALLPFNVVGIVVDTGEGGLHSHRIERGGCTGTGTISHISWADDIQKALTEAMHKVFAQRALDAEKELAALGVETGA